MNAANFFNHLSILYQEAKPKESISFTYLSYHQWSFTVFGEEEKKLLFAIYLFPSLSPFKRSYLCSLIYDSIWDHIGVFGSLLSIAYVRMLERGYLASVSTVIGQRFSLVLSFMYILKDLAPLTYWIQAFYHLF